MNVARACEPASARLSLQSMSLSYFRNRCYLIAEKYNAASQSHIEAILLIKVFVLFVRCVISDICAIMCAIH